MIRRGEDSGIPDLWSDGFPLEAQSGFTRSGSLPSQPDPYRIINRVEEYGSTKTIFRHVAKLGIPELLFFTLSRGSSSPNWMAAMGTTTRSLVKVERPVSDFESGRLLLMIDEGRF